MEYKKKLLNITKDQIKKGLDIAYKKAKNNAYFGEGFNAGVQFVIDQLNKEYENGRGHK